MPFDRQAHAFIPDDTPDAPLPWLSTLEWYATHGYTDPDPADSAVWTLTGRWFPETRHAAVITHTGRLRDLDLAGLGAVHPQVRVWHVTGRARAPYADTALPDDVLGRRFTLRTVLAAAAGTELDDAQLSGVADTISTLLADGEPFDDDNDVAAMVLETIARMREAR